MSLRETLSDVFHERTNFDFIGPKNKWFAFSGILILIGLAALGLRGLNLGIDFKGGTAWEVKVEDKKAQPPTAPGRRPSGVVSSTPACRSWAATPCGSRPAGRPSSSRRRSAPNWPSYANAQPNDVSINDVGPTWGEEVSRKAVRALIFFFLAIAAYLWLRFEWKMALAALAAVVHDILITVGAYAVTGFPVTPSTVIAFLTILGFSLYDTVVVFDKVDENVAGIGASGRETYSGVVNRSMNEVLMRSLNTSITAVLPVLSLLIVGAYLLEAATLKDFALALFIGLLTGAYSSIFIATPFLAVLKEREPRYTALRQKLAGRAATVAAPAYAGATGGPAASPARRSTGATGRPARQPPTAAARGAPAPPRRPGRCRPRRPGESAASARPAAKRRRR